MNIAGWVEIENKSGATFENAKAKLIAGDANRVYDFHRFEGLEDGVYVNEAMAPQAEEKSFFDYHMYTLLHPTTLKNNQTKQINILSGSNVPYKKYYQLEVNNKKVNIVVEFANTRESGLGIPMPKGKVKLYNVDEEDGSLEFMGKDFIDHTPKDESIKLKIGNAFDITFDCREVGIKRLNGFEHYRYEYTIKNHKDESAEVHFNHKIWGAWEMVSSSHDYIKKSSSEIEFVVEVPANGKTVVCFEYRIDKRLEIR